jgi:hypothetical protein
MNQISFSEKFKNEMIDLITKIFCHIPCRFCRNHACKYVKNINRNKIIRPRDLELVIHSFHNSISKRINKPFFPREKLIIYKNNSVKKITREFADVLTIYYRSEALSIELKKWMKKNENKFIHKTEVPAVPVAPTLVSEVAVPQVPLPEIAAPPANLLAEAVAPLAAPEQPAELPPAKLFTLVKIIMIILRIKNIYKKNKNNLHPRVYK